MLLKDQLEYVPGDWKECKAAWQQAAFSGWPDHTLRRYFEQQFRQLIRLPPGQQPDAFGFLLAYYPGDPANILVPLAYRQKVLPERMAFVLPKHDALQEFLEELRSPAQFCYRTVHYAEQLFGGLVADCNPDDILLRFNFNHLDYFACLSQELMENSARLTCPAGRQAWLRAEKARIAAIPEILDACYHPDWPSLKTMLLALISEQIQLAPETNTRNPKLKLNLSVAQLACFLKLAFDEDLFKEAHISDVLRFFSSHCAAKRQGNISVGSLGKEYYSTGQVTAAVTRDKLQKMLTRLNRNFFPV